MSSLTNGFVLGTLSVLASGYIIYDAPICRLWWPRISGYALYFKTAVTGLAVFYLCYALLDVLSRFDLLFWGLKIDHAPFLAFPFALILWVLTKTGLGFYAKYTPEWEYSLNLKSLDAKGLDQFIYERISDRGMIMVTMENGEVYTGWPFAAPNNEDSQWLRLVPQWSGYRDKESTITVQTNYTTTYDTPSFGRERMLLAVEKIVTVQPFDRKIFQKFNPN